MAWRWCLVALVVLGLGGPLGGGPARAGAGTSAELVAAEQLFWQATAKSGNRGLLAAYLLHFRDGAFAQEAARRFEQATGERWSDETAAASAWRAVGGEQVPPGDISLAGEWMHEAECDFNLLLQDIAIRSTQRFHLVMPGVLGGESVYRHSEAFHGWGRILELRRAGSLVTYVMRAENNVTGHEIHIGVLNLRRDRGRLVSRGWEMNTAGAYCELSGAQK